MDAKLLAGSILTGISVMAAVMNAWAQHFFFTMFHIARGESLEGVGSFSPGPYGNTPEATQIFLGLRILIWVLILGGLILLVWGIWEEYQAETAIGRD
jgi:cytochrome b subunit of formate dehydrogenase